MASGMEWKASEVKLLLGDLENPRILIHYKVDRFRFVSDSASADKDSGISNADDALCKKQRCRMQNESHTQLAFPSTSNLTCPWCLAKGSYMIFQNLERSRMETPRPLNPLQHAPRTTPKPSPTDSNQKA